MIRAVIDTNVLVAAMRSRNGASFALLSLVGDERWAPAVSSTLLLEYEEVCLREARRSGLSDWIAEAIIDRITAASSLHSIHFRLRPQLKDPDDEFVLELAAASQAEFLVTHNIRDFQGSDAFGVRVVTPKDFLRILELMHE